MYVIKSQFLMLVLPQYTGVKVGLGKNWVNWGQVWKLNRTWSRNLVTSTFSLLGA